MLQIESRTDELLSTTWLMGAFGGRRAAAPIDLAAVQHIVQEPHSMRAIRVGGEGGARIAIYLLHAGTVHWTWAALLAAWRLVTTPLARQRRQPWAPTQAAKGRVGARYRFVARLRF